VEQNVLKTTGHIPRDFSMTTACVQVKTLPKKNYDVLLDYLTCDGGSFYYNANLLKKKALDHGTLFKISLEGVGKLTIQHLLSVHGSLYCEPIAKSEQFWKKLGFTRLPDRSKGMSLFSDIVSAKA